MIDRPTDRPTDRPGDRPGARPAERVILVDRLDRPVGTEEKLAAHEAGRLHRAFSVFVLNGRDELLLQRRAEGKYHSPGLWSNTCCSHPRPGEATEDAAHRRLVEEMGFDCPIRPAGALLYRAEVGAGLVEHEYDHLFLGRWEGRPAPDPAEVGEWRWVSLPALRREIADGPHRFTFWLRAALAELDRRGRLPGRIRTAGCGEDPGAAEPAADGSIAEEQVA